MENRRFVILVADSAGCGALPDARAYGDVGTDTLGNVSRAVGGLHMPNLEKLGLGYTTPILGVPARVDARGYHGKMQEKSQGKDTITGHWEMMGIVLDQALATFPNGFPPEIVEPWLKATGAPGILGNRAASGTEIIKELGEEHQRTGKPILYTSADSVFQVACHEETVPLDRLYAWCQAARTILDPWRVARVIARPFVGKPGAYKRTYNRKDFAMATPGPTVLEALTARAIPVIGVGKIPDIYDHKGITDEVHTEGNADGLAQTEKILSTMDRGLLFVNLVDFDMLYGHRNDPQGYARALEEMDQALPRILGKLRPGDVLALTADHGCDPTDPSTDHSREYVPLVVYSPGRPGGSLGIRESFCDLGQSVAHFFGVPTPAGKSFLEEVL
jgi:phosphopentomutase